MDLLFSQYGWTKKDFHDATPREINFLLPRLGARINREVRLQAELHGLKLEAPDGADTSEGPKVHLNEKQQAAADARLKEIQESIQRARSNNQDQR